VYELHVVKQAVRKLRNYECVGFGEDWLLIRIGTLMVETQSVYGKLVSLKHLMWVSAQEDVSEDLVNLLI
jgi:hypothetical protein